MSEERPRQGIISARIERLQLSEKFLDEVILPTMKDGSTLDADAVNSYYQVFCKQHALIATTFDVGHVWSIALRRDVENKSLGSDDPILTNAVDLLHKATFPTQHR